MNSRLVMVALCATAASGFTLPETARAQGAEVSIEEIITTARRREESLQETPVSVSAFGPEQIANRGIRSVDDVARYTPGLSFAKAFGRSTDRPVIRGQGNVLAGVQFGVESGAAYFIDGIYYPGDLSSLDLANIERVEVIRGPQAALYGRNTYSGAINFVTKSPGDKLDGNVRARYGQFDDQEVYASVRGPLTDSLSGSLTGRYYTFGGQYRNLVTGRIVGEEETTSISGRLDFAPTDAFTLSGRLLYQEDRDGTRPFFLQPSEMNNCNPGTRSNASWLWTGSDNNNQYYCGEINRQADSVQLNDGDAIATILVPGIPDTPLPGFSLPTFPPGLFPGGDPYNPNNGLAFSGVERDILLANLKADWQFDNGFLLTGQFASRTEDRKTGSDSDHSSMNYLYQAFAPPAPETVECAFCASGQTEFDDVSFEVRLESPADNSLRWMVGAFYYDQTQDNADITFAGVDPVDITATVENVAVFGSIETDITDNFTATLELRYFDEKKGRTEIDIEDAANNVSFENSFDEIAPRLSLNWRLNDDMMLYGIYAKGYKPGGVIGSDGADLVPPTTTYEQEESDNFELGLKSTLLDGRMIANASVFFIDASDIQLTTPLSSGGSGALTSVVTNQGSGETFGIELDVMFALTENLTVGATYALADTEFTEGCDDFQWTLSSGGGILSDADACTGTDPSGGNGNGSIVGNQFPLSSENQFSAYADFRTQMGEGEFFANLNYSWEDEKPVQVHNLAWVPAASLVDARLGWENESWTVAIYGRNLTDEDAPSMVTRWLQDPLLSINAGGAFGSQISPTNAGAPAGFCVPGACSTNFPRAFFGDMRLGRNAGVEVSLRFGS